MSLEPTEVALDFKDALQDLRANARFEINNLTVIAKENTEHAQAISEALESHIKETRPEWKLPALYVLDSVVKNVGTPYTVYLGRNLYRTFMDAYSQVDPHTRKAMENLFKTWKQPVPDSLDTRPVFQPQVTREIENALLKHRTLVIQARPPSVGGNSSQNVGSSQGPPPAGWVASGSLSAGLTQSLTSTTAESQPPTAPSQQVQPQSSQAAAPNTRPQPPSGQTTTTTTNPASAAHTARLRERLMELIFTASMKRQDDQTKQFLESLMQLQAMLGTSSLPADKLALIETELDRIRSVVVPLPGPAAPSSARPHGRQPSPFMASSHSRTGSGLRDQGYNRPRPSGPTGPTDLAQIYRTISAHLPSVPEPRNRNLGDAAVVISALKAAGYVDKYQVLSTAVPALRQIHDVTLDSNSLKMMRPNLVSLLYDVKPVICLECGRRFESSAEGRQSKRKHMDWHFVVNTKLADQSKVVVSRSWFGNETDWIRRENTDEAIGDAPAVTGIDNPDGQTEMDKPTEYVLVPTDLEKVDARCPVCQENFRVEWHNEEEQLVWMDAVTVDGQTYHASSCYPGGSRG